MVVQINPGRVYETLSFITFIWIPEGKKGYTNQTVCFCPRFNGGM